MMFNSLPIEDILSRSLDLGLKFGMAFLIAVLILIVGWVSSRIAERWVRKSLMRFKQIDVLVAGYLSKVVRYTILVLTFVTVLTRFGVQTTSLVALVGAIGLGIGLALQGALSDVASGLLLLSSRPIRVGDWVVSEGLRGRVVSLTLFKTELQTADNRQIFIPNAKLWSSAFENLSYYNVRRLEILMSIAYKDDIEKARKVLFAEVTKEALIHQDPEPQIFVQDLSASSVDLMIWAWVDRENYIAVQGHMKRVFKEAFDREGLSIPFPQQEVHYVPNTPTPVQEEKKS